jgi:Protein of unknown function (DUF1360)
VIALAFATAAISMTVSKTKVFRPVRNWTHAHSEWFGELIECPYCTIHWVAFAAVAVYRPVLVNSRAHLLDLFISAFVLIAVASIVSGWIFQAFAGTAPAEAPTAEEQQDPDAAASARA